MSESRPEDPAADTFRRVYFGPLAEPLISPSTGDPILEEEDELTRAALEDPEAQQLHLPLDGQPTLWRLVVLVLFAVAALGIVFIRR